MGEYRLETDLDPEIERLRADILERRWAGEVLFFVRRIHADRATSNRDIADAFVAEVGCSGLGKHWLEIDRQEALWVLTRVLWGDICYDVSIMTRDEALNLAARFTSLFNDCTFFTNGTWKKRVIPLPDPVDCLDGFWPITQVTADTGVVAVGADRIGMLWVKDED
ncbi:MAG TPA: hypothetical protein VK066_01710 [Chloroflexota bacterium]|nr:hypothetical protein [Chloroflexota bacterium]